MHNFQVFDQALIPTTNTTPVQHMSWIHSCVAIDSGLNHLTVVVNGQPLEDKAFPIPDGAQPPPKNLTGKLDLFRVNIGALMQVKHKVSNLNIFSRKMTLAEMVSRTSGGECGKADGDYLDWESSKWVLSGEAKYEKVEVEDLCRKVSKIQVFTAPMPSMKSCRNLCEKMHRGTATRPGSLNETKAIFERLHNVVEFNLVGKISKATWFPIRQRDDGSFVDLYSNDPVKDLIWATGHPTSPVCVLYGQRCKKVEILEIYLCYFF